MVNRIFFVMLGIAFIMFVYTQVKKKKLSEKESFFWICGSILMLLLSIFPNIINKFSNMLGIVYAPSLLFLLGIIFTLGLVFRLTMYITKIQQQNKELAQRNALLEKKILDIEEGFKRKM